MAFSWNSLEYPLVICPPMDGITDMAYRELVAGMGGCDVLYTEFVNVKGIHYENPKTFFELRYTERQRPMIAQLFGSDPDIFYEAAKVVVRLGFDGIDINMGCPARKVAGKGGGCALMGDSDKAALIVKKTIEGAKDAVAELRKVTQDKHVPDVPVTCKMRLGVDAKTTVLDYGFAMAEAGAEAIAIHGRTLKQMYTGDADWEPIRQFKEKIARDTVLCGTKVFGSGDVKDLFQAFVRIVTTGVDGVMIGRGSFGNPWVFEKTRTNVLKKHVSNFYEKSGKGATFVDLESIPEIETVKQELSSYQPQFSEIKAMALQHAQLMLEDKGVKGIIQMRKHLGWYFTSFPGASQLRAQLVRIESIEQMKEILENFEKNYEPDNCPHAA